MSNLDHQIEEELHASAAGLEMAPGDLSRVMARSRTRGRRQSLAAVVAVVLVAGTVAMAVTRQGNGRGFTVNAHGNIGALGSPGAALREGDVGLAWESVGSHSALGYATTLADSGTGNGSLYALSTAPGVSDPTSGSFPTVLYRSSDGVEWDTASGPSDAYLSDLSASGAQLYGVGTGPATVADNPELHPLVVASSPDGGTTWNSVELPIDLAAIAAGTIDTPEESVQVASSPKGVLVVAQVEGEFNVAKYLPAGVTAPNGWVITATGVDLLGPIDNPACPAGLSTYPPVQASTTTAPAGPPAAAGPAEPTFCAPSADVASAQGLTSIAAAQRAAKAGVSGSGKGAVTVVQPEANHPVVQSFTWAQLGVSGALEQSALSEPFVFFSPDGKTFQSVALPNAPSQATQVLLAADADSFAIAATSTAAQPGTAGQELLWQSGDGTTWAATGAAPADQAGPSAVGYLGGNLTLVSGYAASGRPTVATLDGSQWSESSLGSVLGLTASQSAQPSIAAIGPFGIAVVVGLQSGTAVQYVTSSGAAVRYTTGSGAAVRDATGNVQGSAPQVSQRLLVSRDGTTWSNLALNQLAGSAVESVPNLVVTSNRFLVTAQLPLPKPNTPAPETILVGTAR